MKKIALICALLISISHAQDAHEFSLHLGGGLSTLLYEPSKGSHSNGLDAQFGFGYALFFSPRVGLATGLELAFYSAEYTLKNHAVEYDVKDIDMNMNFTFASMVSNYIEDQSAAMLQIPLMLQLQTGGKQKQYIMMGVKAAIPLSGTRNSKADLANSGYYPDLGATFSTNPDGTNNPNLVDRGFGKFPGKKVESSYDFETSIAASMEIGTKWRLQDGLAIYAGVYLDYGLGNILEKRTTGELSEIIEYNEKDPVNYIVNGALDSKNKIPSGYEPFAAKVRPLAIGAKIKLALGLGVNQFAKEEEALKLNSEEVKRLESEKLKMEKDLELAKASEQMAKDKEAERLAAAERLLQEARLAYESAQREQHAMRLAASEVDRLAAEKTQLEREVSRMATAPQEAPQVPAQIPMQSTLQTSQPGDYAVQVAVMLEEARASLMVEMLKKNGFNAYYRRVANPGKLTGIYYRVRVGYFSDYLSAESFAKARLSTPYGDWWIDKVANDTRGYTY
jgi:cell division septation protein DedD